MRKLPGVTLRADRAIALLPSPSLQHGVLEVLAQEVGVAAGDGAAGLESVLLDSLSHFHEKLGHLPAHIHMSTQHASRTVSAQKVASSSLVGRSIARVHQMTLELGTLVWCTAKGLRGGSHFSTTKWGGDNPSHLVRYSFVFHLHERIFFPGHQLTDDQAQAKLLIEVVPAASIYRVFQAK